MKHERLGIRRWHRRQEGVHQLLAVVLFLCGLLPAQAWAQGPDSLIVKWTAPADDPGPSAVSLYDIRISTSPINEVSFAFATPLQAIPPQSPGVQERYIVRGIVPGQTYWLAVRSADAAGNWSPISNVVRWPSSEDTAPPATPTGFDGVKDPGHDIVQLAWNASSAPDLAGYVVYRSGYPDKGWEQLTPSPITATEFLDPHLPPGMSHLYYTVTAFDRTGNESARAALVPIVLRDQRVSGNLAWHVLPAYPNPAHVSAAQHLPFQSALDGSSARVEIFDGANQLVRRFDLGGGSAGASQLDWDGRNDHGAICAPGVYRVQLTSGDVRQSLRVARVP